ncbi:hypothetical protein [Pseudoxanthomonas sacheonensis]|uniref:Secreted protein n=1 Tax=Pseudoxanthomonas sacheonensis TaxID=443615 RepID=A0ABU1RW44_9GAMM|nr:hypothetical protein [Pseudoxanthomonas sacheonensis]MDR6842980.1 hypothetical protein [Pseudoxanthomonas sacheonensis]
MRLIASILVPLVIALSLTSCAAPNTTEPATGNLAGSTPPPPPAPPAAPPPRAAPPMSSPTPPRKVKPEVAVVTSCKTNADCAVKNVGNCCGAMPACVNKDSPTDPAAVQAQCAAKGMMSVCGFQEISACQCDDGQCAPAGGATPQVQ